jgi:hypothetical protein
MKYLFGLCSIKVSDMDDWVESGDELDSDSDSDGGKKKKSDDEDDDDSSKKVKILNNIFI